MLPALLVVVAFGLGLVLGRRNGAIALAVTWLVVLASASVLTYGVFPASLLAMGWDAVAFVYGSVIASFGAVIAGGWIGRRGRR